MTKALVLALALFCGYAFVAAPLLQAGTSALAQNNARLAAAAAL
jgi:hypothetical protein